MNNLFLLFLEASLLVQTVIIILILASIYSWSLIITKNKIFKNVIQETINFEQKYYSGADIGILFDRVKKKTNKTPIEVIFCEGLEELSDLQEYAAVSNETIEKVIYRAMNIEIVEQITKLEKTNKNFIYGLAADQSPQIRTINYWTNFLGVETLFFTGSERLAKELNIPVVFGEMKKIKRGKYQMEFKLIADKPLKLKDKEITEIYKKMVENQIKTNPSYYFWTHRRFKHEKSSLT